MIFKTVQKVIRHSAFRQHIVSRKTLLLCSSLSSPVHRTTFQNLFSTMSYHTEERGSPNTLDYKVYISECWFSFLDLHFWKSSVVYLSVLRFSRPFQNISCRTTFKGHFYLDLELSTCDSNLLGFSSDGLHRNLLLLNKICSFVAFGTLIFNQSVDYSSFYTKDLLL